jgi:phosphate transport system substrate-binding protein
MKNFFTLSARMFLTLCGIMALSSCGDGEHKAGTPAVPTPLIEGLTLDNFPVMDGSTSTDPLVRTIACELLGYEYEWAQPAGMVTWELETMLPESFINRKLQCSQTHGAFMNLIGESMMPGPVPEIIFSARKMSADEKEMADFHGIELIQTPIALDALIFIANSGVSVNSLTHRQLEDIYTLRTKNWKEVGGGDLPIVPFVRNQNSGSQELMESIVMTEPIPEGFFEDEFYDFQKISSMYPLLTSVAHQAGGLGYTVFYYMENIVRHGTADSNTLKTLAVNGVHPDESTIANRTYPFTAEVYMIIRSDLDRSSMAYKIYEFMQTDMGKHIVGKSEYVPI